MQVVHKKFLTFLCLPGQFFLQFSSALFGSPHYMFASFMSFHTTRGFSNTALQRLDEKLSVLFLKSKGSNSFLLSKAYVCRKLNCITLYFGSPKRCVLPSKSNKYFVQPPQLLFDEQYLKKNALATSLTLSCAFKTMGSNVKYCPCIHHPLF